MPNPFLKKVFSALRDDVLAEIETAFSQTTFAKGDFIYQANKTTYHYYFVESGAVRSYALTPEGKDVSTGFYLSGDIVIDWPSFFMRIPTKENYVALADTICWGLDYDTFQTLFNSIESFREAGRARLVQSYFALKRKSIAMITDDAKTRYETLLQEQPQLIQQVSLKQLASYLGITDTSLSRIRKEIAQPKG